MAKHKSEEMRFEDDALDKKIKRERMSTNLPKAFTELSLCLMHLDMGICSYIVAGGCRKLVYFYSGMKCNSGLKKVLFVCDVNIKATWMGMMMKRG
jgi:hypothetical protein